MAVPARKTSKARKNKRRSSVWKMDAPTLVKCPNCGGYAFHQRFRVHIWAKHLDPAKITAQ